MGQEKIKLNQMPKMAKLRKFKIRSLKHRNILIIGVLAALAIIYVLISNALPLSAAAFTLHPQKFTNGFTEQGDIIAAQEWPIFNPVEGKLESLKVQNGDKVQKGQVLFEMSTSDLNYQLEALKAQLQSLEGQRLQNYKSPNDSEVAQQKLIIQQAVKDAQTAELNLTRMKALHDAGSISQVQYEDAQTAAEKAANYLQQQKEGLQQLQEQYQASQGAEMYYVNQKNAVQAQIDQVQDKISKAMVVAPQDGMVKDLTLKEGNVITQGQQVMTVFSGEGYKIESYVLASDALDIKVGSPVQVIQAASSGNKSWTGQVEEVDPSAVERISPLGLKESRVKVTISLAATSPVVLGSTVDVKFTTLDFPNKLVIPKTALFPYQQGDAVWVIRQGKAKIQPVKKGLENESQVLVEQGLVDGDIILQDPNITNLKEGVRIKAIL